MQTLSFYNRKKVLITGGAGFIGSHLARRLVKLGAHVTILDNFSSGTIHSISDIAHKIEIIVGDIRSLDDCKRAVFSKQYVFHLAALASVPKSIDDPELCNEINVDGSWNLTEACSQVEGPFPHIIFSSSSAVYGQTSELCHEELAPTPCSPYAQSKLDGEAIFRSYTLKHNAPCTILRYFNVFGSGQKSTGPHAPVVAKFRELITDNKPVVVFGDGLQTRDYVAVDRVVDANLASGMQNATSCPIINVGSGKSITLLELVNQLEDELGQKSVGIDFQPSRDGEIYESKACCKRLDQLLATIT